MTTEHPTILTDREPFLWLTNYLVLVDSKVYIDDDEMAASVWTQLMTRLVALRQEKKLDFHKPVVELCPLTVVREIVAEWRALYGTEINADHDHLAAFLLKNLNAVIHRAGVLLP